MHHPPRPCHSQIMTFRTVLQKSVPCGFPLPPKEGENCGEVGFHWPCNGPTGFSVQGETKSGQVASGVEWRVSTFRERRKQDGGCCITLYSPRGRIGESKMAGGAASPRERPVKRKKKPRWRRLQRPVYNT
jgi:hypothetical protein